LPENKFFVGTQNVPAAIQNHRVANEKKNGDAIIENRRKPGSGCRKKGKAERPRPASPYTGKNVDDAIAHLERVLSVPGATCVLGRDYWHTRVTELFACPALAPIQKARISRLAQLLASLHKCGCRDASSCASFAA
jgi:hypothetical protein